MLDKITTQHVRALVFGFFALILVAAAVAIYDYAQNSKEVELQTKYYEIEKDYLDKKMAFDKSELAADSKAADKSAPAAVKPTGNIDQDYGTVISRFEDFVAKDPKTNAAKLAAMDLADLYSKYNQNDKAEKVLSRLSYGKADLLTILSLNTLAKVQSVSSCKKAVETWQKELSYRQADFLSSEIKLNMAVCYDQMGDSAKAKSLFEELKSKASTGSPVAKIAEKYLRVIK